PRTQLLERNRASAVHAGERHGGLESVWHAGQAGGDFAGTGKFARHRPGTESRGPAKQQRCNRRLPVGTRGQGCVRSRAAQGRGNLAVSEQTPASPTRISETFARLRSWNQMAFMPFITAGDPDLATTQALIRELAALHVDLIEVGF